MSYAKLEPKLYIKTNLPFAWASLVIIEIIACTMLGKVTL